MTVATTRGTEMTVGTLVETAYKSAGVMDAGWGSADGSYPTDVELGRVLLDVLTKEWQVHGLIARNVQFYDLTLTSGTYRYDLPTYALDVVGDGMYFDSDVTDATKAEGETLVTQVDLDHWHRLSNKGSESRPYQFATYRVVRPIQVWLHNIPDDTGSTVRFRVQREITDADATSATIEFEPYWYAALIAELGARLARAKNLPATRVMDLRTQAKMALELALGFANQRGSTQMVLDHRTQWSR